MRLTESSDEPHKLRAFGSYSARHSFEGQPGCHKETEAVWVQLLGMQMETPFFITTLSLCSSRVTQASHRLHALFRS